MRRILVAGAVVAAGVLAGSPALAAPPEISQRSCEAEGGTFSREQGVKSCTVTTTRTDYSPEMHRVGVQSTGGLEDEYTGYYQLVSSVESTTVRSQKGNGEVTTSGPTERTVATVIDPLRCELRSTFFAIVVFSGQVDLAECALRGLFTA